MDSLDRAIDLVLRWKDNRKKERAVVLERLESVIKDCQAASEVWQEYHDHPGKPGDRWTLMSWMGPERAKSLPLRGPAKCGGSSSSQMGGGGVVLGRPGVGLGGLALPAALP